MVPNREVFWNVSHFAHFFIYVPAALATASILYGIYKRYRLWKLGRGERRHDNIIGRVAFVLKSIVTHSQLLRNRLGGLFHLLIFYGFVILFIGTLIVLVEADFGLRLLTGNFYVGFTIGLNLFGLLCVVGLVIALVRRYVMRPAYLERTFDDFVTPVWLLLILVLGFLIQGARLAHDQPAWAHYSFIGAAIARWFMAAGITQQGLVDLHRMLWWIHMFAAMGFLAYFPFSKLFHILLGPVNVFLHDENHPGTLKRIPDIEEAESFGVQHLHEFTWKDLFDTDVCVRCGRCENHCPAHNSEKALSPRRLILDLRQHLSAAGPNLLSAGKRGEDLSSVEQIQIQGNVIDDQVLWDCTTCRSCMHQCPLFIEHIPKIIEMRRYLVMMESRFPKEVTNVFKGLENNQNPWNVGRDTRADWAKGLDVPLLSDNKDVEYLYWVGCAGSFDDRNQKVSKAMVKILKAAGVSFGILGTEEGCCGDTARRSGNEYLAQILIEANIETLKRYDVKKIIVTCPHGYNAFKNEYPQFGASYEVIHHTELISDLIKGGRIKVNGGGGAAPATVFHDSCYLGRYNGIYSEPRDVLKSLGSVSLVEMEKNRGESFCCGAGGARMWMEEATPRISDVRTDHVVKTGAKQICTVCPFCLNMLSDGVKDKNLAETHSVVDLAELVAAALE